MPKLEAKRGYPGESMRKKKEIFGNFFGHGKIDWKFKVVNYRKNPISS